MDAQKTHKMNEAEAESTLALLFGGAILAGGALACRRSSRQRVLRRARRRYVDVYGPGEPLPPEWLLDPSKRPKEIDGAAIPDWLTLDTWKALSYPQRRKMPRYWTQHYNDIGRPILDKTKMYTIEEAVDLFYLMNERCPSEGIQSFDIGIGLNLDARFPDQTIRTTGKLPHGTGKTVKVAVFCEEEEYAEVMAMGACTAGRALEQALEADQIDFDVLITKAQMMPKLAKLGRILGPKRLMPSPKSGTVVADYQKAITEFSTASLIEIRTTEDSWLRCGVGTMAMGKEKIKDNIKSFLQQVADKRPVGAVKEYWTKVILGTTTSQHVQIDESELPAIQVVV